MTKQIDFAQNPDKKTKRTYWIITSLTMALIILPSYFAPREYLIQAVKNLQFPDYFTLELDILKIVGAIVILIQLFRRCLKNGLMWASESSCCLQAWRTV